jgi:hypothetical protein
VRTARGVHTTPLMRADFRTCPLKLKHMSTGSFRQCLADKFELTLEAAQQDNDEMFDEIGLARPPAFARSSNYNLAWTGLRPGHRSGRLRGLRKSTGCVPRPNPFVERCHKVFRHS